MKFIGKSITVHEDYLQDLQLELFAVVHFCRMIVSPDNQIFYEIVYVCDPSFDGKQYREFVSVVDGTEFYADVMTFICPIALPNGKFGGLFEILK